MMYLVPTNVDTLVVMLAEKDLPDMREGRTRTIETHQLAGRVFDSLVISLHKDHEAIRTLLSSGGYDLSKVDEHVTKADPTRTNEKVECGCGIELLPHQLFEGRCIICWAADAKRLSAEKG